MWLGQLWTNNLSRYRAESCKFVLKINSDEQILMLFWQVNLNWKLHIIQIFLRYQNFWEQFVFVLGGLKLPVYGILSRFNSSYTRHFKSFYINTINMYSNAFLSFVLKIISHNLTVVLQDRITCIVFIVPALTKKWAFNLDNTSCFAETVLLLIFFLCVCHVMMEFMKRISTSSACTLTWQLKHTCNSTIAHWNIQQHFNTLTRHSWFFLWHRAVRLTSFLSCVSSSTHDFSPQSIQQKRKNSPLFNKSSN